jgi:hypothetical protein
MKCKGNSSFVCGGFDVNSVYTIKQSSCSEQKESPGIIHVEASAAKVDALVNNWQWQWSKWDNQKWEAAEEAARESTYLKDFKAGKFVSTITYRCFTHIHIRPRRWRSQLGTTKPIFLPFQQSHAEGTYCARVGVEKETKHGFQAMQIVH